MSSGIELEHPVSDHLADDGAKTREQGVVTLSYFWLVQEIDFHIIKHCIGMGVWVSIGSYHILIRKNCDRLWSYLS